jgi:riboflavin kinase/FMN adenylyltransferase
LNIYPQLDELPAASGPVVATIGNFDGVHRGHQGVIAEVIARARALGGTSLAVTFNPHPAWVLRPEHPLPLITPLSRKLELLAATGLDAALVLPFDDALRRTSARDFAEQVLVRAAHVTEIHEGESFRFGYRAAAEVHSLEALGREFRFSVAVYAPLLLRGAAVSSSRIRGLIGEGNVSAARALLRRPFAIDSTPAPGRGYGSRYTVPTINLAPYAELLPANGVYVTSLAVGAASAEETFDAVTNVGNRPTFGADSFAVESHLLNFRPIELTEQTPLHLTFLRKLREERRFPTTEALRDQIAQDVGQAKRYFDLCTRLNRR